MRQVALRKSVEGKKTGGEVKCAIEEHMILKGPLKEKAKDW